MSCCSAALERIEISVRQCGSDPLAQRLLFFHNYPYLPVASAPACYPQLIGRFRCISRHSPRLPDSFFLKLQVAFSDAYS